MGSNNSTGDAHPRFGFTEQRIVNQVLTDAALAGIAVNRPAGLSEVVALGIFTLTGGAGSVGFRIEASNDGVNWFTLSQTSPSEFFTTTGQVELLNAGNVSVQHFAMLRVRATIEAGAPTFSLQAIVTGISSDSEKFLRDSTFGPRLGVTPSVVNGSPKVRPAGTLFTNVQVNASGVVLGTLTSFDLALQGSPDGGTTWVDIGVAPITADGSQLIIVDAETFVSMGSYGLFRTQLRDNGVADGSTAFTAIEVIGTLDSSDWILIGADDGIPATGGSSAAFISVGFGAPGPEVADTISISLQVFDAAGGPLAESRKVELILYDTANAGDEDLALNATFSAVSAGTIIGGLATNRLVLTTDASGVATVDVLNVAAETMFLTAVNNRGPSTIAQIIIQSSEATLTFA